MVVNVITKDLMQDSTSQHELAAMFKTQVHDLQSLTLDFFRFRKPKNKFTKSSPICWIKAQVPLDFDP